MTARIVTSSFATPQGVRHQAWCARMGSHTSPIGNGKTEAEAIADLEWMLEAIARTVAAHAAANPVVWPHEERW